MGFFDPLAREAAAGTVFEAGGTWVDVVAVSVGGSAFVGFPFLETTGAGFAAGVTAGMTIGAFAFLPVAGGFTARRFLAVAG